MKYERIEHLKDTDFKRLTGVQRETFEEMLKVVEKGRRDFGRPPKLSRADQLLMTLMYWREYRAEFHIAQSYGVSEATVCRTIRKVENILVRSKKFRLPGKKALQPSDTIFEVILVAASEQPVERPKKGQEKHYSGKKRRHTQKAQLIAHQKTAAIVATAFSQGSKHDFQLFQDGKLDIAQHIRILADAGYQGLADLQENCQTPFKKSKYHPLTKKEKQRNRSLARKRIVIEHIFRKLKVFRILSESYRNRRKRFALRFNLIAAIYNHELTQN
ncbi:MAG TPA: IS5 family transposase [Anaerolineales bacterium]|nr:IS5 family transposase [Anaerolineales bacterium]